MKVKQWKFLPFEDFWNNLRKDTFFRDEQKMGFYGLAYGCTSVGENGFTLQLAIGDLFHWTPTNVNAQKVVNFCQDFAWADTSQEEMKDRVRIWYNEAIIRANNKWTAYIENTFLEGEDSVS